MAGGFDLPVYVLGDPSRPDHLFVVEQGGVIFAVGVSRHLIGIRKDRHRIKFLIWVGIRFKSIALPLRSKGSDRSFTGISSIPFTSKRMTATW